MVVTVGIVALATVLLAQTEGPKNVEFYMFEKLLNSLEESFHIELLLCQIILSKMDPSVRLSNPFSQQLDLMISQSGVRVPNPESEDQELKAHLKSTNSSQNLNLEIYCRVLSKENHNGNSFFNIGRVINQSY